MHFINNNCCNIKHHGPFIACAFSALVKAVEALPENGKSPAGFNGRVLEVEPTMQGTSTIPEGMFGGTYSEEAGVALKPRLRNSLQHRDVAAVSGKLRFEVRRLFENSGFEEHQHHRRAGSVNVAALHSVATGNTRVFKRRVETAGIDSAVVLMLDVSESMFSDGLITTAVAATVALSEALTAAGVDVCVALFGDRTCILSPFGQPFKRKEADLRRVHHGGGTNDYFAVRYAQNLLLQHKAERKVLFMITDGMGAPATRHQVDMGERMGVTTIGLGIHMDVSSVYPNNVTVNSIASLGTVAFNKIKLAA
jgi:Mg-chelatase subunit ChlD